MDIYERSAKILATAKHAVVFTGAGVSAESGIPTFRDPGGVWDRFEPEEIGTVSGIVRIAQTNPNLIREFLLETLRVFEKSWVNQAHIAIADLEKRGIISMVITQNIDALHREAGNQKVLELHGNLFRSRCLSCGKTVTLERKLVFERAHHILDDDAKEYGIEKLMQILPSCSCGGTSRPDVVMFSEPVKDLHKAFQAAASSDVMLILGTSGYIYPAAACPEEAHRSGAKLIEINPTDNYYKSITEFYIKEAAGLAMPKIMKHISKITADLSSD